MASVKIILKHEKLNLKGEVPLYLRIIKDRKPRYVSLGYNVKPGQWDEDTRRVRKSHPNAQRMNNFIAQKVAEAEAAALELESKSKHVHVRKIKDTIMGRSGMSFFAYADTHLNRLRSAGRTGTWLLHSSIINKLRDFNDGADLLMEEFTVFMLKNFEDYMRNKRNNSDGTIKTSLLTLQTVLKGAISEDLFPIEKNPFLKYKVKGGNTEKIFLSEAEIQQVDQLELSDDSELFHARNMYVFACYAGGLRLSDLIALRWGMFDGERINIGKTIKTADSIVIKLPQRALEIINLYHAKGKKPQDYIFPFNLSEWDALNKEERYMKLRRLKTDIAAMIPKVGELAGIKHRLHFHTSRHTFATRALRKGMRIEYVSRLMGHTTIKHTQVYAKIVNEELENAMEVFDMPESGKPGKPNAGKGKSSLGKKGK